MKKTLTINLSGSVFHIDDDAYEKLHAYLIKIDRHFGKDADAKEIVEDIEARIAEIFAEKVKNGDEVINIAHVEEIIVIMGTPEAISNEEEEKGREPEKKYYRTGGRRFYRDPEDKILGGVCSGLGAYFSIDPVIIRLIFVLLFFAGGSSFLAYLILWIVVPKAYTTAQRLEMRGEEVNIDNISKSIKEEVQDVKENFRNYRSNPAYVQSRSAAHDAGNALVSVLKVIGTILLVIIGIPFVFVGVVLLIVLFSLLFASSQVLSMTPFEGGIEHLNLIFSQGSTIGWIWAGLFLVVCIPLLMLVYAGIKMIFRFKSPSHIFGSVLAGLFVVGIFILIINGSRTLGEFSKSATVTNQELVASSADTLYITAKQLESDKGLDALIDNDFNFKHFKIGVMNGKEILIGSPELRIEKGENTKFEMVINKISRGYNLIKAKENADEIPFKYQIKDSLVNLQPSFMLPGTWRNQRIKLKIEVPVGKTIYLDESVKNIIWDVRNTTDTYDYDMVNKYWTMKSDGLTLVNRAVPSVKSLKNKK
jgi:phage shock protein PspC (stress-responsive transcriptional regulator)